MAKEKKKKKGSYGKVAGFCVVGGCLIALLAFFGDGIGLGGGDGGFNPFDRNNQGNGSEIVGESNDNNVPDETANSGDNEGQTNENDANTSDTEAVVLTIRIEQDTIYLDDAEVSREELVVIVEQHFNTGAAWDLYGERGFLETTEAVRAILRENGAAFTER